jgi:hypothetical protein
MNRLIWWGRSSGIDKSPSCSVLHKISTRWKTCAGRQPQSRIKVSAKVKTFVLNTNVLLHDPQSVFKFEENNLAIPVEVLGNWTPSRRAILRTRPQRTARAPILQELLPDARAMHEGVELDNGGRSRSSSTLSDRRTAAHRRWSVCARFCRT